jgi:hypothetical protein
MATPFNIPEMHALRKRLQDRVPNVGMLKVWNGNEGPTLEQLIESAPPRDGVASLINDMEGKKRR